MHYGIATLDGLVHHIECSPFEIEAEIETLGGGHVQAEGSTLEIYERRLEASMSGKVRYFGSQL